VRPSVSSARPVRTRWPGPRPGTDQRSVPVRSIRMPTLRARVVSQWYWLPSAEPWLAPAAR